MRVAWCLKKQNADDFTHHASRTTHHASPFRVPQEPKHMVQIAARRPSSEAKSYCADSSCFRDPHCFQHRRELAAAAVAGGTSGGRHPWQRFEDLTSDPAGEAKVEGV